MSNFRSEDNMPLRIDPDREGVDAFDAVAYLMRCMACNQGVMVVEDRDGNGIHSYPTAGTSNLDSSVDAKVASCYAEGHPALWGGRAS